MNYELMEFDEIRAQLEELHQASFGWAMACCRRDKADAEEVLQTAYLKVLEGKARYNASSSFKTWLFAVIRRTAADQRRRIFVRSLFHIRASENAGTIDDRRPDESAYRSELQTIFRRAMAQLPARQREVLHLVFYSELSIQEASVVMGVSLGSARTHYDRGKRRLQEMLQKSEELYESEWRRKENRATVP